MALTFYFAPTISVLLLILANSSYTDVDRNRPNNLNYGLDIQFAPKFPSMTVFVAPQLPRFEPGQTDILGPLQIKHEKSTRRRHRRFSKSRVRYYSNSTASFAFKLILLAGDIEVNPGMPVNGNGARKPQNNIKIAHLNARSITNRDHYILTKNLVAENDFDIFTISETWLDNSVTDLDEEIPGYDVHRLDRHEKTGGGVCAYVGESYKTTHLQDLSFISSAGFHQLLLQVQVGHCKSIVICTVYRPPNSDLNCFDDEFSDALISALSLNHDVYILGDLN